MQLIIFIFLTLLHSRAAAFATNNDDENYYSIETLADRPITPPKSKIHRNSTTTAVDEVKATESGRNEGGGIRKESGQGGSGNQIATSTSSNTKPYSKPCHIHGHTTSTSANTDTTQYCCKKHSQAVTKERERFILKRKTQNRIKVELILSQLDSYANGFIRSSTLLEIAHNKLKEFNYTVPEEMLQDLVFNDCEMDLATQRRTIGYIDSNEIILQHSATVLPVKRYSASLFVNVFCDLLEELDREYWR